MKILSNPLPYQIISASGPLTSAWSEENVMTSYPAQAFISDALIETLTVAFDASSDSLFLGHVLADKIKLTFDTGDVLEDDQRLDWNKSFVKGRKKLSEDWFVDIPSGATSVDIELTSSTDLQEDLVDFVSNATGGYLRLASTDAAYFENYPQLRIGTHLNSGQQITLMKGVGDGEEDLHLSTGGGAAFVLSNVYLPVSVGILRIGKSLRFPNPKAGLVHMTKDLGVRRESRGSFLYSAKNLLRAFSVPMMIDSDQLQLFIKATEGIRGAAVAMDLLEGLDRSKVGMFSFSQPPDISALSRRYSLFEINFELSEIG